MHSLKALFLDVELFIDPAIAFGILFALIALGVYLVESGSEGIIQKISGFAQSFFNGSSIPPAVAFWFTTLTLGALLIGIANHFHDEIVNSARNWVFPGRADRLRELEEDMAKIVLSRDPDAFKTTLAHALMHHAKARFVHAYVWTGERYRSMLAQPARTLPELTGDEDEIARMRKEKTSIQLDDVPSVIPGVRAFPMFLSGKLTGFVVCGPSTVQSRYGDDEIELIEAIARVAGATYRVLVQYGDPDDRGIM